MRMARQVTTIGGIHGIMMVSHWQELLSRKSAAFILFVYIKSTHEFKWYAKTL